MKDDYDFHAPYPRDTCFVCKVCNGCFKHWECSKPLCKGDFDKDCEGKPRK